MKATLNFKQKLPDPSQHTCWSSFGATKGGNFLKYGTSITMTLLLLLTLIFSPGRTLAQVTAGFELDGNATAVMPNPPDDWDLIYNGTSSAQVTTGIVTDLVGTADNIFVQGSKDINNTDTWHWAIQSAPDKDEILHAGAALYDGTKIYFFADRFAQNGDAQIGFWLFKNPVYPNPDGTFTGVHAIGDILLLTNFVNGGGTAVITAYEWVGSGGSDGTLNLISVNTVNLYAITNSSAVASPWPYTPKFGPAGTFPIGAFFEGGIDLAGIGFGIDPCFSSFLMETRSSSSVTAELKDFVFGNFFTKPQVTVNTASICVGGAPVTLTASIQGGVGPYTYLWSNGATTSSITVSPSVTTVYTVTVSAANGCQANPAEGRVTVSPIPACSIGDPNPPLATVICNTPGNTISTVTNLDVNLYTLVWSITPSQAGMTGWNITSGQGTNSIVFASGQCGSAGATVEVSLTVTDKASGCTSTCTKTITPQAPQCGASSPNDSLNCTKTQASLTGVANSDNPNPILLWTASNGGHIVSGANTLTVIVDEPGTYTFTVTDAVNGCSAFSVSTVTEDIRVPVINETHTNISCNGLSGGAIDISVSGGLAPYTYLWSNGATTQDISGLAAGSYTVTVTGANGCTASRTIVITQPDNLVLNTQKTDVLCNGASTGSITASATGGTAPYQFSIDAGAFSSNNVFSNLAAGTYVIHVRDANSCEKMTSVTISQPTLLVLNTQHTDALCNGATGSITASATGGTAPYMFSIDAGAFSSNNVFSNLAAGTYTIHVKDANNCEQMAQVTISQPNTLVLNTQKTDALCNGGTASITASATGGTAPYQFSIDAGAYSSNNVFSNLPAGTYVIHVKDANNCEQMTSVTISQPSLLVLNTQKVDVLCNGGNGSITASATGGTAPYQFSIGAGAFSSNNVFSNLVAGTYVIHVKDANNCEQMASVTISQPALLVLNTQKVDVLCNGGNGSITASATGGTAPYQFSIDAGAFSSNNVFSNLAAGTYVIHVKDANNCEQMASVTISQPSTLVLNTQKTDVLCNGGNGSITASAIGGTAPYQFSIDAGAFSSNNVFSGLAAGTYVIHVRDANNCEQMTSVTISQPSLLVLNTQKVDVNCFGLSNGSITASATGGTAPYQFSINSGAFSSNNVFSGLAAGTYVIHVRDANNCEQMVSVTITQPPVVSCMLTAPNPVPNCGSTDNVLTASVSNAVSYQWSTDNAGYVITSGQGTASIMYTAGEGSVTFKLIVMNSNGCVDSCMVTFESTCIKTFCTLTQGFWGQANGRAPSTGERARDLIVRLLGAPYGDIVIGAPGRSLTITQASASCVTLRMPGGGPAAILPAGNQSFGANCATTIPLNNNGRFRNNLLSQTIALSFNVRLDTNLASLVITNSVIPISASLDNALTSLYGANYTIGDLLDLANRALGGLSTGGASLTEIAGAVGAINERFDGCKDLDTSASRMLGTNTSNGGIKNQDMAMKAYPNPFANSTTIEFTPKTNGNVNVSVYSLTGARVAILFNGKVKADETKQVIFNGENLANGIYVYKISVDDKVYFDKLILQK